MASAMTELVDISAVNTSLPYIVGNLSALAGRSNVGSHLVLGRHTIILHVSGWLTNYFECKRLWEAI